IVSHDRCFMDKLCTKLLVFEGEGRIKEWVGSYTELRERQKMDLERSKVRKESPVVEVKVSTPTPVTTADGGKKKLTYAEKLELQKIDKEMPKLEARKNELLIIMASGNTDHHKVMEHSIELERTTKELDRMTDRWLELSDRA
ncbi:MAG TPA: ABC transporter ATP-binding protein, partial [Flavobacteriales bacterium]|nr:ABC transporter ATP-binding protein [Flavobacteriales bacterium]